LKTRNAGSSFRAEARALYWASSDADAKRRVGEFAFTSTIRSNSANLSKNLKNFFEGPSDRGRFRTSRNVTSPLSMPSMITGETDYLLNAGHPDFKKTKIGKREPFTFNPLLLKR